MEKKGQQIAEALRWVHVPTNGIGPGSLRSNVCKWGYVRGLRIKEVLACFCEDFVLVGLEPPLWL
jgi:hypothetical protein